MHCIQVQTHLTVTVFCKRQPQGDQKMEHYCQCHVQNDECHTPIDPPVSGSHLATDQARYSPWSTTTSVFKSLTTTEVPNILCKTFNEH